MNLLLQAGLGHFHYKLICPFKGGIGGESLVARLSEAEKKYLSYWRNVMGETEYHKKCVRCSNQCKQSFRCLEVLCPKYQRR